MTKNNLEKKHAKLSASGADKWLNCPGSVNAESKYKNTTSGYAEEGTLAHELADRALSSKKDAEIFLGKTLKELKIKLETFSQDHIIDKDMVNYVQEYLDYVRSHETNNTTLYTEERVDFSHIVPEGFGTTDASIIDSDTGICHVFDLKYGKGVIVYATDNNQGKMYCLGLYNELRFLGDIKSFRIHIVQPRIYNFSYWDITVKDLLKFGEYAKERATLALSKNPPLNPGNKQCQWCRAKDNCKALYKFTEETLKVEFDDFDDEKDITILSDQEKKNILDNEKNIINLISTIKSSVYLRLCHGDSFEGYKIVEGTSNRVLIDGAEEILIAKLGDNAYDKKLKGLGKLEKELSKDEVNKLTFKPKGRIIMVPESDKRQALESAFAECDVLNDDFEE